MQNIIFSATTRMFHTTPLDEFIKDIVEVDFCTVTRGEPDEFVVWPSLL